MGASPTKLSHEEINKIGYNNVFLLANQCNGPTNMIFKPRTTE